MDKSYNLPIQADKPFSNNVKHIGITTFDALLSYIKNLPYGRNSNRRDYSLVLKERKGTCSTKHALLAQIALENDFTDIKLCLGIYKMTAKNTPGVEKILNEYQLDYIPEAHCYLKFKNQIIDCTRNVLSDTSFEESIMLEEIISPEQIGTYKVNKHQAFIKDWLLDQNSPYSFGSLWKIREICIQNIHE